MKCSIMLSLQSLLVDGEQLPVLDFRCILHFILLSGRLPEILPQLFLLIHQGDCLNHAFHTPLFKVQPGLMICYNLFLASDIGRSEERRVGKGCRSRLSTYCYKIYRYSEQQEDNRKSNE